MKRDRALAFSMILLQAVMLALFYESYFFALVVAVSALMGAFGVLQFDISRPRQLMITMLVAVVFAAKWQYFPAEQPYSFVYLAGLGLPLAQFFITLEVFVLFLVVPWGLPLSFPVLGVMAISGMGDMAPIPSHFNLYHVFALGFVALAAIFLGFAERGVVRVQKERSFLSTLPYACALSSIILIAAVTSVLAEHYQHELDAFLANITPTSLQPFNPGFSKVSRLQSVNEIKNFQGGRSVALRVFSDERPEYLRAKSYTVMRASEWTGPMHYTPRFPVTRPEALGPQDWQGNTFGVAEEAEPPYRTLKVWPTGYFEDVMFTLISTGYVTASTDMVEVNADGIVHAPQMGVMSAYSVHVVEDTQPQKLSKSAYTKFVQVPKRLDPRLRELAKSLFKDSPTAREKTARVVEYFLANYSYEIGIKIPHGIDPITHFLLEKPAAHCEYFASAAALLLRLGGVPCRYVTGFMATERNPVGGYWIARNRDAHAWVEAHDEQIGWFIVEATPDDGVPSGVESSRFTYTLDDLRYRFNAFRIALLSGAVKAALGNVGAAALSVAKLLVAPPIGPLLVAVLLLGLVGFLVSRLRAIGPKPLRDPLHLLLEDMDAVMSARGSVRSEQETLHNFAQRLGAEHEGEPKFVPVGQWYRRYAELRYGRGDTPLDEARTELQDRFETISRSLD